MNRIAIWLGASLGALFFVAVIGIAWIVYTWPEKLVPPANPEGQQSISQYALDIPVQAGHPPELLDAFSWDDIASPPKSARAWTRWWWPGGNVETEILIEQLALFDSVGFGGVEIQPFNSGLNALSNRDDVMGRVFSFDSPGYYQKLQATIEAAAELGMQVDLTHFSGWPPGGPEVNLEDSLTTLAYSEITVSGDQDISVVLPLPKAGPNEVMLAIAELAQEDFINFPSDRAELISVVAARKSGGHRSRNLFNMNDTVALEESSLTVLTDQVEKGVLNWQAPAGEWRIIASYVVPSGEVPMVAAQKPPGFVVDHLRVPQVKGHYEYAYGERTGLPQYYGAGLRGFFNDSLEFRLKRMTTADILQEFEQRRGYDLEPYLPAVYLEGHDSMMFSEIAQIHPAPEFQITAMDDRIRYDYQRTLSDLMIERFIESSAMWAGQRGLISRGQSYGMGIDVLRALGANTVPETEQLGSGGANAALNFASSAAALYGQTLVSAESFVWSGLDYAPVARRFKAAADKLFLAGINHIIYHGTPYPLAEDERQPFGNEGWTPFSGPDNMAHFSSNVSPGNTAVWPDVPALNAYIARVQNLLRQGTPAVDVLIYYPFLSLPGMAHVEGSEEALVAGSFPDADPRPTGVEESDIFIDVVHKFLTLPQHQTDERLAWLETLQPLLRALENRGISWGWVNDHALQNGNVTPGRLPASGGAFQTVLLANIESIDQATVKRLTQLTKSDVPVLIAGTRPERQHGFSNAEQGDEAIQRTVSVLLAAGGESVALDADAILGHLSPAKYSDVSYNNDSSIHRYRRDVSSDVSIHFFANQSAAEQSLSLTIPTDKALWWFDPVEGVAWPIVQQEKVLGLKLGGFASRFLIVGMEMPDTLQRRPANAYLIQNPRIVHKLDDWQLNVAGESFSRDLPELMDWRDIPELALSSDPGVYTHSFEIDGSKAGTDYLLDLGLVQGSAQVIINSEPVAQSSIPPFITDISAYLKGGKNEIEVIVQAPLRNGFVGRALSGDPRYAHMKSYENKTVAAGLIGPVTIAEIQ
ncbi:MAG: hypothetical protein KDI33_19580 [Halioglobus sp.]|nr:hypothetical protein [Halioglobus sp.]